MSIATDRDQARLEELNEQYIEAAVNADANWYRQHLAEDFVCIDAEGAVFDKEAFLRRFAGGPMVSNYTLENVTVRIYGETALVQATGYFTRKDGMPGMCRYIDVYVRAGDDWKAVSAQITKAHLEADSRRAGGR
jgi:ketosteroid isomerase-like protein